MSKEFSRAEQIAAVIQRSLATIIQQLKDPRCNKLVSIAAVKVTRDLAYAKVYVTSLAADADNKKAIIDALNHASGFMRKELGRELGIYKTPQLKFIYDESLEYGNRLSRLIDDAVATDQEAEEE